MAQLLIKYVWSNSMLPDNQLILFDDYISAQLKKAKKRHTQEGCMFFWLSRIYAEEKKPGFHLTTLPIL